MKGCYSNFFFNDTATTEIYTLSLHDALPIYRKSGNGAVIFVQDDAGKDQVSGEPFAAYLKELPSLRLVVLNACQRSEEHTSELQSRQYLVCRLLLEKKKSTYQTSSHATISNV